MSGILGIWNLDGRPVDRPLLANLTALLAHRGPDGEGRWIDGSVGFAFQNMWVTPESVGEVQPLVHSSDSVVLFDGRLDNREDLLAVLADCALSPESSDTALVSAAYRRFGDCFAERLNGDFATVVYDIRDRRLLLARDTIGVKPLYFSRTGDTFLIASEIKPILAHPGISSRPNADMLAAYLLACFGQERQGWTFFDGVSSVLPGQIVVITPQSLTKRIYWDFGDPQPVRFKTFPEYAEAFRHYLEQAVGRRLRSAYPVAVSVSGGLDSSSVFCTGETLRRRHAVNCPEIVGISVEVNGPQSDERSFLAEIERQYGVRIHRVPCPEIPFVTDSIRKAFLDMEAPYLRTAVNSNHPFDQEVRRLGTRTVLFGMWADQMLANRAYLIDLFGRLRWISVWAALNEYVRWDLAADLGWFRKDFLRALVRYHVPRPLIPFLRNARRRLVSDCFWYTSDFRRRARRAERVQEFAAFGRSAHQRSLYQLVRPMYYVQALEWSNKIAATNQCEYAYPFFDRDLVSFLFAIPGDIVCAGGIPKALLRAAMRNTLPAVIAERRWKADTTEELNDAMEQRFTEFQGYLQSDVMAVELGYVDESRLCTALERLRPLIHTEKGAVTTQLGDLFGLELWLQTFFGTKSNTLEVTNVRARA